MRRSLCRFQEAKRVPNRFAITEHRVNTKLTHVQRKSVVYHGINPCYLTD